MLISSNRETMHASSPLLPTDQLQVNRATKSYPKSYIRCHTCRKKSIESKLTGHLIFGEAECTLCSLIVIACRTFQEETSNSPNRVCNHRFEFSKPFDHLYDEISRSTRKMKSDEAQVIAVANGISAYLSKLGRVEAEEPWMSALLRSREKIKEILLRGTPCPKELNNNEDIPGGYALAQSDGACSSPVRENGKSDLTVRIFRIRNSDSSESSGTKGSQTRARYSIAGGESTKSPRARKPLPDTQPSSALTLSTETSSTTGPQATRPREPSGPQATPYGTRPTGTSPSTSGPQATPHERLSSARSVPEKNEIVVTGFLDTPPDGYYYVSRRALEECPMCYAALCPSRFTVNVQTFLLTTVCIGCGLTIYLVFEPPDGSAPKVAIVTENQRLKMAKPDAKARGKEKKSKTRRPLAMQGIGHVK